MLNRKQLKNYSELRCLSTRDVAAYCDISQPLIVQIENGDKAVTRYNHDEIVKGINTAFAAKQRGTFVKPPRVNQPKTKADGIRKKVVTKE